MAVETQFKRARFRVETGPESLFMLALLEMSSVHSVTLDSKHFTDGAYEKAVPREIIEAATKFDIHQWKIVACVVEPNTGNLVTSTWEKEHRGQRYWLTIAKGNVAESITLMRPSEKEEKTGSGELIDLVDRVSSQLLDERLNELNIDKFLCIEGGDGVSELSRRIGATLPAEEEEIVLHHSTCFAPDSTADRRYRAYRMLGNAVVRTVVGTELYTVCLQIGVPDFASTVVQQANEVGRAVADKYSLGELTMPSCADVGSDTCMALIGAMYRTYGYIWVRGFLLPFVRERLGVALSGVDAIGWESICSSAKSRWQSVGATRMYVLEHAGEELQLPRGSLTAGQFELALRSAYGLSVGKDSDGTLCKLGSSALDMLALDYIDGRYGFEFVSPENKKASLLKPSRLVKSIPIDIAKRIPDKLPGVDAKGLEITTTRVNVVSAVLAAIWSNYAQSKSALYETAARELMFRIFDASSGYSAPDYSKLMSNLVTHYRLSYTENFTIDPKHKSRKTYRFIVIVSGSVWQVQAVGSGTDKYVAKQKALKPAVWAVLDQLGQDRFASRLREQLKPERLTIQRNRPLDFGAEVLHFESKPVEVVKPAVKTPDATAQSTNTAAKLPGSPIKAVGNKLSLDELRQIVLHVCSEKYVSGEVERALFDHLSQITTADGKLSKSERKERTRTFVRNATNYIREHPDKYKGNSLASDIRRDKDPLIHWKINKGAAQLLFEVTADILAEHKTHSPSGEEGKGKPSTTAKPRPSGSSQAAKKEAYEFADFDGPKHTLYVCKGTIACKRKGHHVTSATGVLASLNGEAKKINVNYCIEDGIYFIDYSEYCHYRDMYGNLLGNLNFTRFGAASAHSYGDLASESILKFCGYSVAQGEGLSERQRRMILANVMDRRILSKNDIIIRLQFFIRSHQYQPNMRLAVSKWQSDLQFVRNYRINAQRHFVVEDVKRYR